MEARLHRWKSVTFHATLISDVGDEPIKTSVGVMLCDFFM